MPRLVVEWSGVSLVGQTWPRLMVVMRLGGARVTLYNTETHLHSPGLMVHNGDDRPGGTGLLSGVILANYHN